MAVQIKEDPMKELQAERDRLLQRVRELEEECTGLRQERSNLEKERDAYLKTVYAYLKKTFTEEDRKELERRARDLEGARPHAEILEELRLCAEGKDGRSLAQYIQQLEERIRQKNASNRAEPLAG